ncbi:copper homeostasis protein CutC [Anaerosalibacter massiliensis]|uniref:PF03932 family protein CutC n=1 Tax=Anaerosalibacter massiliensis TaxID=1347392 RepID=A0A9X2S433_9FIRM|nr:copper homeostasis protein CutC [Anaerosalibacter massiliensis]MCR2043320.1 copper homeostasis protein CutC [Anaerosalibacter massiliensis]
MLEIIATCIEDAMKIEENGGGRIELISSLTEGGLTPSYGLIEEVIKNVDIPVNVMIRPHAKSFVYSDRDIEIMIKDIEVVKKTGANGVVLGVLNKDGSIDEKNLEKLLKHTGHLEVTFHKAIDESKNIIESFKVLKKYPQIKRVLTSGGIGKTIIDNTDVLKEMIKISENQIIVLLGGGLTLENVEEVIKITGAREVHFGTAIREDKEYLKDIDAEELKVLSKKVKSLI